MLAGMILASPIQRDWFDWTNFGVGLCGLALTLWAVREAKGAKHAAQEARETIWRREVSFVVAEILSMISELANRIDAGQVEIAILRAREIASRIARDQGRFKLFFGSDSGSILDLERSFSAMAEQLSSKTFIDDARAKTDMATRVHQANRTLNAIYGRLQSGQDEEG